MSLLILWAAAGNSSAAIVRLDPGEFANGDLLNGAFADVVLTQWLTDIVVTDGVVTEVIPYSVNSEPRVFAYNGLFSSAEVYGKWSGTSNALRADFTLGATSVTQVFSGGNAGFIQARAFDGSVIDTLTSEFVNGSYSLTLASPNIPIAYIYASSAQPASRGGPVDLGMLQYSTVPVSVPEPSTLGLFAIALCGLAISPLARRPHQGERR